MTQGFTNHELTLPEQPCRLMERSIREGWVATYIKIPQIFFDIRVCYGFALLVSGPPKTEESLQWQESAVIPATTELLSNIFVVLSPQELVTLFGPGFRWHGGARAQLRQFCVDLERRNKQVPIEMETVNVHLYH